VKEQMPVIGANRFISTALVNAPVEDGRKVVARP
jgi:hypothetical protein